MSSVLPVEIFVPESHRYGELQGVAVGEEYGAAETVREITSAVVVVQTLRVVVVVVVAAVRSAAAAVAAERVAARRVA